MVSMERLKGKKQYSQQLITLSFGFEEDLDRDRAGNFQTLRF